MIKEPSIFFLVVLIKMKFFKAYQDSYILSKIIKENVDQYFHRCSSFQA